MSGTPSKIAALTGLVTAATAITAARPTVVGNGVDITPWIQSGYLPAKVAVVLLPDGADRTIAAPTGGTAGFIELWAWKADRAGVKKWFLVATLPNYGGATIPLINGSGGYLAVMDVPPGTERLQVAGTPSAGAPTWYAEPIEFYT